MKKMIAFFGTNCEHSQAMAVDFYEFLEDNKDVVVETHEAGVSSDLAKSLKVFMVPSFIMMEDGKEYCRAIGKQKKQELFDFYHHDCVKE